MSGELREAALPPRHPLAALVLAALAGVVVQGVVAGTLLVLLLRAGIVPSGVWPVTVVAGAWIGAEIAARFGASRRAGGLIAGLPVLTLTTLLALQARMAELGFLGQALVLVTVVALNGVFAFVGIWAAGVRARWAARPARQPVRPPAATTPMVRPGE